MARISAAKNETALGPYVAQQSVLQPDASLVQSVSLIVMYKTVDCSGTCLPCWIVLHVLWSTDKSSWSGILSCQSEMGHKDLCYLREPTQLNRLLLNELTIVLLG